MVSVEDDPDLSRMLRAGVDLDDDGDFDPTNLLSQPINFDEDIDELGITIDEDSGDNAYLEPVHNGGDGAVLDGERNNESYYDQDSKSNNEVDDHRQKFFRAPSPDHHRQQRGRYNHGKNEGVGDMNKNMQQRRSSHEYDDPPYNRNRNINSRGNSTSEHSRNRVPRNSERIAEVQHKIRQVQQQIHENMDGDQNTGREMMGDRQHSYRQEPGYSQHQDQEQMYSDNYPDEPYHNGDPRDRFSPPRDSSRHGRHRSYNGMPRSMRGGADRYDGDQPGLHQRRSHQQPLHQQHQHREQPMMSHSQRGMHSHNNPRGNDHDDGYGPQDRHHPMGRNQPSDGITQSLYDGPPQIDNSGQGGFRDGPGVMQQQHVLGGMSQSLNGMGSHRNNVSNNMDNPIVRQMSQSFNSGMPNMNMNASNNGNMPRRGIQSMSDSLNGMSNPPRMDPSNNGMDRSANGIRSNNRGIQSMSASLNGMQNMNNSTNNNQNAMMNNVMMAQQHQHQERGIQSMSASLNGMQQMNAEQNMSQSTNGMQGVYGSQQPGGPESMGMPMNRSMNGMQNMQHNHDGGNFRNQHRSMNPMSASQNAMPNMNNINQGGGFPPQQRQQQGGSHPLQGMSQSLNGAPNAPYDGVGHHESMSNHMNSMPGDHGMQINNSNMSMMNRSNNMGSSMNGTMNGNLNGSKNGGPMLNNSNIPSASLLNQVSNLANLPNRGGGAINIDLMHQIQGGGIDPTKMTKFMEAMKRTASSRKLIRDLNIGAMLRGDLKSPASSNKNKSVVKAKRKSGRQSYTNSQSEAAASREFLKAQKQKTAV